MRTTSLHFVVLHHTNIELPHFDLLFETIPGSDLTTFRVSDWPIDEGTHATRLRDHRRLYLTYSGPIPGQRGHVSRVQQSNCLIELSPSQIVVNLGRSVLRFEQEKDDAWWVRADHQA